MIYRLDPAVPLVWRDPHTLQLGVDRVVCVFPQVTPVLERMLAALRIGAARSLLEVTASVGGLGRAASAEVDDLLASVSEALLPTPESGGRQSTIVIDGDGPTAERLMRLLRESGHSVAAADRVDRESDDVAAVVIFGSFVIPPWRHGPWLRRDIPHLPIVFGDAGAEVGPLVEAEGPCLRCLSLARTDADPAWPAIAAQLDTHAPSPEPVLLSAHVASLAARWLDARLRTGDRSHASTSMRIEGDGRISSLQHSAHGLCGCRGLPENVTALVGRPHSQPSSTSAGVSHA